ncbi:MAG: YidC/Oxa1 family membrane protein insertase [Candidatus Paceibacterota bacterium]|jgi:YidC/Oxa1 family membrane protein insertase
MIGFFKTILFIPLYNLLIFITSIIPGADLGLAIIVLTILVKLVIFPLYKKSVRTQIKLKSVEPKLKEIKEKYKDNLPEQSRQTMEIYRQEKINPFSTILVLLIQIPIIITLYYVFRDSFNVHTDLIYSFVSAPSQINTNFLGWFDLTANKSIVLSVLTGLSQYLQVRFSLPTQPKSKNKLGESFKDDLMRSMDLQMRYFMPLITVFIAFTLPSAIAVYWVTSNSFSAIYEMVVIKKIKKEAELITPKVSEKTG